MKALILVFLTALCASEKLVSREQLLHNGFEVLQPHHFRLIQKMADLDGKLIDDAEIDRKLAQVSSKQKATKRVAKASRPAKRQSSLQDRLRGGTEMLELAREGQLFDIDVGDVYDISEGDIKRYIGKVRGSE